MKEQDYMKIMNGLREDYISEAVSWDGTAQKNRRAIRRMTYGLGAIAAAIAVVIGTIGYSSYRDHLAADSESNPDIAEERLNILGGYGELHGYLTADGRSFFRDNSYFYGEDVKWAIDGSTPLINVEGDSTPLLLTDGKQLYTQHDGNVYVTDSYGGETLAFSLDDTLNCVSRIHKLPNGDYFAIGTTEVDTSVAANAPEDAGSMPHTEGGIASVQAVVYHMATGEHDAIMVMSYADPQQVQYGFLYQINDSLRIFPTITEMQRVMSGYHYQIDDSGDAWYFYDEQNAHGFGRVGFNVRAHNEGNDKVFRVKDFKTEEITGFAVHNDTLWFERLTKANNENGETRTFTEFYTMQLGDSEPSMNYRGDYDMAKNSPETDYPCYSYFGEQYLYGVMQKMTDSGLTFKVMRHAYDAFDGDQTVFEVPVSELYGDQIPDRMERPDMIFGDTGDYLFFTLPEEGINGEKLVQVNLKTGTWFYLGMHCDVVQTPEQNSEMNREDSYEGIYGETLESGYCSPETFPQYYIPAENLDSDRIDCYRMLPFAKASESKLDPAALGAHLPEGGTWSRRDPDAPRMTYEQAFQSITSGGSLVGWQMLEDLCKLSAGYDAEAYLNRSDMTDREFWLDDAGKEFFYVVLYGELGSYQDFDRAEFYFFCYDEAKQQYHYARLPDASAERLSGKQPAGTNFLGGSGTVHPYVTGTGQLLFAEDDLWYYDLGYGQRAPKQNDPAQTVWEALPQEAQNRFFADSAGNRRLMMDGSSFYTQDGGALYRLDNDGTEHYLMMPDEEMAAWNRDTIDVCRLCMMHDDRLFVMINGQTAADDGDCFMAYLVDVKTNIVTVLPDADVSRRELYPYWNEAAVTDEWIYSVSDNGTVLHITGLDGSTAAIDLAKDAGVTLDDGWFVGEDGQLWYGQDADWYHMSLHAADENYLKPQKDADAVPYYYNVPVRGATKVLGAAQPDMNIILCNYNGSGAEVLLDGTKNICDCILGVYCEGGVYHIAAEIRADAQNNPTPQTVVITKDGSSVSAFGILPMPQ
ncbi:MAG: hypothetical protein IK134_01070 [Oscillospiraceae bacterium]|nr:hypothetical protein [Oscillospiraceae bacterium]